jgi:hypothetical protein
MALMNWAIDVPQELLQSDAKPYPWYFVYNKYTKNFTSNFIYLKFHYMGFKG